MLLSKVFEFTVVFFCVGNKLQIEGLSCLLCIPILWKETSLFWKGGSQKLSRFGFGGLIIREDVQLRNISVSPIEHFVAPMRLSKIRD